METLTERSSPPKRGRQSYGQFCDMMVGWIGRVTSVSNGKMDYLRLVMFTWEAIISAPVHPLLLPSLSRAAINDGE